MAVKYSFHYKMNLPCVSDVNFSSVDELAKVVIQPVVSALDRDGFQLDYIEDSVGRNIEFDYDWGDLWPKIKRIWVKNDSHNREINYDIENGLLKKTVNVEG